MGEYTKVNNGISMRKIIKTIKRFFKGLYIRFQEKEYEGRLHYIYENNHADKLMIVFSGFSPYKPMYNYMRTLKNVKSIDKLFLLDDFGYRGSYYLMENGKDTPKQLVTELVKTIVGGGNFKELFTMGTSKGGTCAIYFGLQFHATHIFSGACQYLIANYLNTEDRKPILEGMLGKGYSEKDYSNLNDAVRVQIEKHQGTETIIHLLFSKQEHTYPEHIKYLLEDLEKWNIPYTAQIEPFENHDDVGRYFIPYIKKEISKIL